MKKRIIGLLMILTMIVSLVAVPDMAKAATKNYLVLIETKDGKWTSYKDLAYSSGNYLMVKAYSTSTALGLTYKNNDKNLTIQSGKKKLTLTKNSKSYTYYNGSSTSKKTAKYKTYAAKIDKKSTYVVHYSVMKNLVSTFYFKGSEKTAYKKYDGVICYSLSDSNLTLSDIPTKVPTSLPTEAPKPTEKPVEEDKKVGYDGTVTINGVQIPKLNGFAQNTLKGPYWGADNYENGERSLKDAIDEYSAQMVKDIKALNDETNPGETSQIAVTDYGIAAEVNGDSTMSALILSKKEDHYEIYISTALIYTEVDKERGNANYTKISNGILKLFCAVISSKPEELYNAIFDSYEGDEIYGINTSSWTTIGDSNVKYRIENGHAVIYSIKAK